ncbi:hypothetical protein Y024_5227 [Burkholderia pseudomallei TSV44]|nr:hypothetical protein Y024_5227 [Burkholderia pseudomallei TSV44]
MSRNLEISKSRNLEISKSRNLEDVKTGRREGSKTRSSKIRNGWRVWNDWVAQLTRVSTAELRKTSSDPVCSLQFAVCSLLSHPASRISPAMSA